MIVRLLPKNEIDRRKAEERRQTIDEGMRIAERVDGLRETAASEEEAFERYRNESFKKIQEEISSKTTIKDALDADIAVRKTELEILLAPLNKKWVEVNAKEDALNVFKESLDKKDEDLRIARIGLGIQQKLTFEIEKKVRHDELVAEQIRLKTEKECKELLDLAKRESKSLINDGNAFLLKTQTIEADSKARLKSAEIIGLRSIEKERALETREKEVKKLEIVLKDRIKMAERNIERYGKRSTR